MSAAVPAAPAASPRAALTRREAWSRRAPLLPALVITLGLTQIPFVMTIWYSLHHWNLLTGAGITWSGGQNFTVTFTDSTFWKSVVNTAELTGGATAVSLLAGLALAIVLQKRFPGRGAARTLAIAPLFVMPVAVALFWRAAMFNPTFGLLDWLAHLVGAPRVDWLSDYPMLSIILITSWRWTPFAMLVLLAGLQALPDEQLEAASVDGASWRRQLRWVVLPHLRPFLELSALLIAINVIQTFGEIDILTAGGPAYATTNITYYVYVRAFQSFEFGTASAYGLVALVLTIVLVLPALRLLSGIFREGGRR